MSKCSNYVCEGKEVVAINSLVKWQCDDHPTWHQCAHCS